MIRAMFLTLGLYFVLTGAGFFFVDELTLTHQASEVDSPVLDFITSRADNGQRKLDAPEWLPFTCIGLGAVTMMYAVALPKQA